MLLRIVFFVFFILSFLGWGCQGDHSKRVAYKQYIAQGRILYEKHCSNCHQKSGKGLKNLIPPLTDKEYLAGNKDKLACIIKNGLSENITVHNKKYRQPMPGIPLTNLEIAELVTFIYDRWGADTLYYSQKDVASALKKCEK